MGPMADQRGHEATPPSFQGSHHPGTWIVIALLMEVGWFGRGSQGPPMAKD